jgi:hypothetical protein
VRFAHPLFYLSFIYSEVYMFDIFLYMFTVLFVLSFIGKRREPVRLAAELWTEVEELSVQYVGCSIEYDVIDSREFVETVSQAKRHDIKTLSSAELRELCRQHGIPVSDRGRVSSRTIQQLIEVA